ncbi:MAG TPA: hypothetical protein VGW34_09830 [Allosphingosinicella sp.]|nr:hypothetical protein [Allosphingosinicella sp.]
MGVKMPFVTREMEDTDIGVSASGNLFSAMIINETDRTVSIVSVGNKTEPRDIAPNGGLFLKDITRVYATKAKSWKGTAAFYF